nr:acyltransferase [Lysinibacillus timonensis]
MWKQRSKFVVPTMVIVAIISIIILNNYNDVTTYHKVLIIISGTLFSGILSAVLFPQNEHKIDEKPKNHHK